ncbi:MAG: hypothetical protein AAFO07_07145 [Bacteroidota bacterium]
MVIEWSQNISHTYDDANSKKYTSEELKETVSTLVKANGPEPNDARINENETLQVQGNADLKLHKLTLKIEKLGLKIKFTNKTNIEFC